MICTKCGGSIRQVAEQSVNDSPFEALLECVRTWSGLLFVFYIQVDFAVRRMKKSNVGDQ